MNAVQACDLFLGFYVDPAYIPRLQMLKFICQDFQEQNPNFEFVTTDSSCGILGDGVLDCEILFLNANSVVLAIHVRYNFIRVSVDSGRSFWTANGSCIVDQTTDPNAIEHPNLKSYLFELFSKLL